MILTQVQDLQKKLEERVLATPKPGVKDENFRFVSLRDVELPLKEASAKSPIEFDFTSSPALTVSAIDFPKQDLFTAYANDFLLPQSLNQDLFAMAAYARSQSGFFLHVAKDAKATASVRVVHNAAADAKAVYERSVIVCEPGSELTWIDELNGAENSMYFGVYRIRVCKGAKLNWISAQSFAATSKHFLRVSLEIEEGAEVKWTSFHLGGKKGQLRIETELTGAQASLDAQSLVNGSASQEFDFLINTKHVVGSTKSSYEHNTVLADKAHAVFNGNIVIPKEAVKSDAKQKNKNMMLSKEASVDTYPKLEIATDEVSCSHGASISPVNWEQVFYLQSRGISEADARALIVEGFAEPTLSRIVDEDLRDRMRDLIGMKGDSDEL